MEIKIKLKAKPGDTLYYLEETNIKETNILAMAGKFRASCENLMDLGVDTDYWLQMLDSETNTNKRILAEDIGVSFFLDKKDILTKIQEQL